MRRYDLSGKPVTAYTVIGVPVGTYKEIEISIDKLEPGHPAEEPLIAVITEADEPTGVRVTLALNTEGWFRDVDGRTGPIAR